MRYLLVLVAAVLVTSTALAQVSVHVNFNMERQPAWGPTGYDQADNYYLPDLDVYYNVSHKRFFYPEGNQWRSAASLPARYKGYNLYNSYKVVVNEPNPYRHNAEHRREYAAMKGRHDQEVIRDSHDAKYYANVNHPEHRNWVKQQGPHHGNDQGGQRGHDQDRR